MQHRYFAIPVIVYLPAQGNDMPAEHFDSIRDALQIAHPSMIPFMAEDFNDGDFNHDPDTQELSACICAHCEPNDDFIFTGKQIRAHQQGNPSERSDSTPPESNPVHTDLPAAAALLADLAASYEFPGYIEVTAHGRTFHFGEEGGCFIYDHFPMGRDDVTHDDGATTLPITSTPAELAAWIRAEISHPIFAKPINTLDGAKALFRYLKDHGMLFHPEDDPMDISQSDGQVLFLGDEPMHLRSRMAEAWRLYWGEDQCPCSFCLSLDLDYGRDHDQSLVLPLAGDMPPPADNTAKLERFRCLTEYLIDDFRRLIQTSLVDLGHIEADHPRLHILRHITDMEDHLHYVEQHHIA